MAVQVLYNGFPAVAVNIAAWTISYVELNFGSPTLLNWVSFYFYFDFQALFMKQNLFLIHK